MKISEMCRVWTRPLANADPQNFLDLQTEIGSLVDENLWTPTGTDPAH